MKIALVAAMSVLLLSASPARSQERWDARLGAVSGDVTVLGDEIITGQGTNDRIIPWMALASFGWTLFPDKREAGEGGFYELSADTLDVISEASQVGHRHRDFASTEEYVEYIARSAALPKDLR